MGAGNSIASEKLDRRRFLKLLGSGAAAGALSSCRGLLRPELSAPRNVLFIAVDDLRPQLGCYGHSQMISPNIDRLAGEGVVFKRAYCQVPVCGASRGSLMSGVRPTPSRFINHDASVDVDLPDILTLPRHFKDNGYETVSLGKIYHRMGDDLDAWSQPPWRPNIPGYVLKESNEIRKRSRDAREQAGLPVNSWGGGPPVECADVEDNEYGDGAIADRAIEELRRMQGRPFFLAAGFFKPHLPFCAPKKYWDLYPRGSIDLADNPFQPKDAPKSALHTWGELRAYAGIPAKGPVSDEQARELIHGYYACVSYADAQIGRLLDELDRLGRRDNTIIVLWGDHGWQLGEHGLWCKHCNFETSLHSPLIVSDPAMPAGAETDALVEFVDIYPSLCGLCRLPLPGHLEGASFAPLMAKPDRPWKNAVFSRFHQGDSVKTDRYRYTEWVKKGEQEPFEWMLYDHQTDPMENTNIADRPENEQLLEQMRGTLRKGWREALP
jgi:iduronate 2-sulfatase